MPLQTSWVNALFGKLSVRYGDAFMRQWQDANPELVKADWAEVLDGVSGPALEYALANLSDRPPNALQFRSLCRLWQGKPQQDLLPAPNEPADPQRVQAAVRSMAATRKALRNVTPAQQCIDNIERIVSQRGGRISEPQRHMVAHCLRIPGTSTTLPVQRVDRMPDLQPDEEATS